MLLDHVLELHLLRERPSFVEAEFARKSERVLLQWVQDSAYRFFPLVQREPFGLTLHPFPEVRVARRVAEARVHDRAPRSFASMIRCACGLK